MAELEINQQSNGFHGLLMQNAIITATIRQKKSKRNRNIKKKKNKIQFRLETFRGQNWNRDLNLIYFMQLLSIMM